MISDSECDVSMVENMPDTAARHPALSSTEIGVDGHVDSVTIFSYQRYKFKLYQIASPIIGDIYLYQGADAPTTADKIQVIHGRLRKWFTTLPPELRLEGATPQVGQPDSATATTFALQAFALQLAYDNILIVLHRPLLSYTLKQTGTGGNQTARSTSRNQCWESAIRTSRLCYYEKYLHAVCGTHAAAYIGIHLFTAGMVLSVVALSNPLSSQSQEAKQALARIIRITRLMENHTTVSAQSGRILEGLVRLILNKEMSVLLPERSEAGVGWQVEPPAPSNLGTTGLQAAPNAQSHSDSSPGFRNSMRLDDGGGGIRNSDITQSLSELGEDNDLLTNGMIFRDVDFNEGIRSLQEGNCS